MTHCILSHQIQRRILEPFKHLRCGFLQKQLAASFA